MHWPINRRGVLAGSGALLMTRPFAAAARPALNTPRGGGPLPAEWRAAPRLALWEGSPPGAPAQLPVVSPKYDPAFVTGVAKPELRVFRPAPGKGNGRAVLVIPGGAYTFVSIRNEGTDVARVLTARGYAVYVLVYRLPCEGWANRADVPLQDAQRAMRVIRHRAAQDGIDPATLAVIGFSAGGHLVATLLTAFAEPVYAARDAADRLDAAPHCAALVYPVIAATAPYTHQQSALSLLGPAPDAALIARRSPALHVTGATAPTFLVHAIDDGAVPYQNSTLFLDALRAANRPAEAHLFEEGGHGFGIGADNAPAGQWPALFAAFLERQG